MAIEQANKVLNQMRTLGTTAATAVAIATSTTATSVNKGDSDDTGSTTTITTPVEMAVELDNDLSNWLEYMLTTQIKMGKCREKHGVSLQSKADGEAFNSSMPERENIRRYLVRYNAKLFV